jgi:hypothetical protein
METHLAPGWPHMVRRAVLQPVFKPLGRFAGSTRTVHSQQARAAMLASQGAVWQGLPNVGCTHNHTVFVCGQRALYSAGAHTCASRTTRVGHPSLLWTES